MSEFPDDNMNVYAQAQVCRGLQMGDGKCQHFKLLLCPTLKLLYIGPASTSINAIGAGNLVIPKSDQFACERFTNKTGNLSIACPEHEMGNGTSPGHSLPEEINLNHPSGEESWDISPSPAGGLLLVLEEYSQNLPRTGISPIPTHGLGQVITTTPTTRSGQNTPITTTAQLGNGPITQITPAGGLGHFLNIITPSPAGPPPPRTSTPTPIQAGPAGPRLTPEYVYLLKPATAPPATIAPTTPTRTTPEITGISATGSLKTLLENPPKSNALPLGLHKPSLIDIQEDVLLVSPAIDSGTPAVAVRTTACTSTNIILPNDRSAVVSTIFMTAPATALLQASALSSESSKSPLIIVDDPP